MVSIKWKKKLNCPGKSTMLENTNFQLLEQPIFCDVPSMALSQGENNKHESWGKEADRQKRQNLS